MPSPSALLATPAALAAMLAPDAAERIYSLAAPEGTPQRPAVERFEAVAAGDSVLLRVLTRPVVGPGQAVLVVDRGQDIELLDALPSSLPGGTLGFACERQVLDGRPAFWLQAGDLSLVLPAPAYRVLH